MWSGGRSEATDFKVVWPHGANGGEYDDQKVVCVSDLVEGGNARGRPPVEWRDRVQEYVRERGERALRNSEQARRECLDTE